MSEAIHVHSHMLSWHGQGQLYFTLLYSTFPSLSKLELLLFVVIHYCEHIFGLNIYVMCGK